MTFFGPDGSHHQDGMTVAAQDWRNINFVVWRASIGRRTDRTYEQWRDAAHANDKPFCAYHFVYPTTTGTYPASLQAETFAFAEPDIDIPVMLDWEHDGSLHPTFNDVEKVCDAIRALGYKVPLLYTGHWYWAQQGRPTISDCGFELVNSNYGNQSPTGQYEIRSRYVALGGDSSPRWDVSYGGLSPVMWQYGSRISWGNRYMDMNAIVDPAVLERAFHDWTPTTTLPPPTTFPPGPPTATIGVLDMIPVARSTNGTVWYTLDFETRRDANADQWNTLKAAGVRDIVTQQIPPDPGQITKLTDVELTKRLGPPA